MIDKEKVKKACEDYLRTKGWNGPNSNTDHIVLNELENLFKKLVGDGLIPANSVNQFYDAAIQMRQKAKFMKAFGL